MGFNSILLLDYSFKMNVLCLLQVETGQQDGGNLQRGAPRLAHASPLRVIDENDPPESAQSSAVHNQVISC